MVCNRESNLQLLSSASTQPNLHEKYEFASLLMLSKDIGQNSLFIESMLCYCFVLSHIFFDF